MAYIDISTRGTSPDYSTSIEFLSRTGVSYVPPTPSVSGAVPLLRVSPTFAAPTLDAFGRPAGGHLVQTGETVETWGTLAITINGQDVTFFRDVATEIQTIAWQRLGNYDSLSIRIPAATVFEEHGSGDLAWLTEFGTIQILRVDPLGERSVLFLGSLNGIQAGDDGIGLLITAHGFLYDGTYKLAKAPIRASTATVVQDIGIDLAKAINSAPGKLSYCAPVVMGVADAKEGNWETQIDYIRSLLALSVTDAGNAWTIWVDSTAKPTILTTDAIPNASSFTLTAGQDGVADGLALDTTTGATTIYGSGKTKYGAEWKNTVYPKATAAKPRYPMDDPSLAMGKNATDKFTSTGTGITVLQTKLVLKGYIVSINGKFDDRTAAAVKAFQKKNALPITGSVNIAFWSKLVGVTDMGSGAYVQPLAIDTRVQPRLYNTYGRDIGPNPAYDPTIRPREEQIDFGDGVSLSQAAHAAKTVLARDGVEDMFVLGVATAGALNGQPAVEGDLTLTVCPPEKARWDIQPGDTLTYTGRWGAPLVLLVHRVQWDLASLSVTITVSTRDMEYTELDAAMNRFRSTSLKGKKTVGSVSGIGSDNYGDAEVIVPDHFGHLAYTVHPMDYTTSQWPTTDYTYYVRVQHGATISSLGIQLRQMGTIYAGGNILLSVYGNTPGATPELDKPGSRIGTTGSIFVPSTEANKWYSAPLIGGALAVAPGDWLAITTYYYGGSSFPWYMDCAPGFHPTNAALNIAQQQSGTGGVAPLIASPSPMVGTFAGYIRITGLP